MPPPRCLTGTPRTTSLGTNRPQVITKLPDATQGLPGLRFKSQHSKITFHTALILFVQKRWHWCYCISIDTMPVKWMYKKVVSNKEVKLSLIKITRGPFPVFCTSWLRCCDHPMPWMLSVWHLHLRSQAAAGTRAWTQAVCFCTQVLVPPLLSSAPTPGSPLTVLCLSPLICKTGQ